MCVCVCVVVVVCGGEGACVCVRARARVCVCVCDPTGVDASQPIFALGWNARILAANDCRFRPYSARGTYSSRDSSGSPESFVSAGHRSTIA